MAQSGDYTLPSILRGNQQCTAIGGSISNLDQHGRHASDYLLLGVYGDNAMELPGRNSTMQVVWVVELGDGIGFTVYPLDVGDEKPAFRGL